MQKRTLGNSAIKAAPDIQVSCLGLGTMTFGEQNTEQEAFAQMDCALAAGVTLFDTAEMYPVPPREETFTQTEQIVGKWLKLRKCRQRLVLATKVVGPTTESRALGTYIRDGLNRLTAQNIETALEGSLRRLGTETIDLYQIHWPERQTNLFGQREFTLPQNSEMEKDTIPETLETLEKLRKAGKIRAFGVSNETPWGVMRYLSLAEKRGRQKAEHPARLVSIQNPYNLLNRTFESGLAEIAFRESIGLLAYSPLAFGTLSGKYLGGLKPARARLTRFSRFQRYRTINAEKAVRAYVALARKHGLLPEQTALAFLLTRPFLAGALVGATSVKQLETNLAAAELTLSEEVLNGIESIHQRYPNPCP